MGEFIGEYGIVTRAELLRDGNTDAQIRVAIHGERLKRLRPGRYATTGADDEVVRAVTAGGGLTCVSALARHKVWVPESAGGLHVRMGPSRRRSAHAGIQVCGVTIDSEPKLVDDVPTAVIAVAGCQAGHDLVAVYDSVLNRNLLQAGELAGLLRGQPRRVHRALTAVDGTAESGTETRVRLHLRQRRLPYRTQVFIAGVGTVDLLVGSSLVIECDSQEHHGGEAIDDDRDRDLALHTLGFVPLRVSYRQVFSHFTRVAAAIEKKVDRADHLRATDYVP